MFNSFHRFLSGTAVLAIVVLAGGCSKSARAERHFSKAEQFFSAGKYAEAEIEYLNALRLDNNNNHAIARLGTIYYENGRVIRALPFLVRAAQLRPNDLDAQVKSGLVRLGLGDHTNAWTIATNAILRSSTNAEAPLLLAEAARSESQLQTARTLLADARARAGNTAPLITGLAVLSLRAGDSQAFQKEIAEAIQTDSGFAPAHAALGTWYWSQKNTTNAALALQKAAEVSPARSPHSIRYAEFQLKTGQVEAGVKRLQEIVDKVPDYLPAWVNLGEIALRQNDLTNCATYANRAVALAPEDLTAQLLRARLWLAQQDADKAVRDLEKLATAFPRSPQVNFFLANAYLMKNDEAKATRSLNQTLALAPDFTEALLLQAQLDIRRDNAKAAIATLTRLINRHPELPQAHLLLVSAHLRNNDAANALRTCESLRKLFPKNPQIPVLAGNIFLRQKNNTQARKQFEQAVELAPEALEPFEQLVNLDLSENATAQAEERVRQKMAQWPKSPLLPVLLAKVHWAQHQTNLVESALKQAIELEPAYTVPYLLLSRLYSDTKQTDKALEQLKESLEKNPREITALMQMGIIQSERASYADARDSYEKLLKINPKFSPALNNLAYLYSEHLNELDKAYDAARKARDLAPNDPYSADTLGWILFRRGEYNWALSLLQESAEKLSSEPEVQFHLGMTYYMLNQPEQARAALTRAVSSEKDFSAKAEASERLTVLSLDPQKADPKTISQLEDRTEKHPSDVIALAKLAEIHRRNGAAEKAAALYERALKQSPKNTELMLGLAGLYIGSLSEPEKGLSLLKEAYKIAPENPEVGCALARQVFAARDHQWAFSLLQQAVPKLPNDSQVLYDLALAQLAIGRVSDALSSANLALNHNPDFSRASKAREFAELVSILNSNGKAQPLVPRAESALKRTSDNLPAMAVVALDFEQRKQSAEALAAYERLLELYPLYTPATKPLAALHAEKAPESQKAYDYAVKARTAFPSDPEVAKTLGIVSYARKDFTRSAQLLKEASAKRPQDAEVWFYLGMTQHQLKQRADAQQTLRKALALNLRANLADLATRTLAQPN